LTPPSLPAEWRALALDPPRALGPPPVRGRLRVLPEDFVVDEELGFEASGAGPHMLLRVRKRDANTDWVARELARLARCRAAEVGFAGLKDRRAVTTQWFTVPADGRPPAEWLTLAGPDFTILEAHRHQRKLPRGALRRNHFELRIRDCSADRDLVAMRAATIRAQGVPNYFGPQRFGRDAANLERALRAAGAPDARRREPPLQRSFRLSAARSLVFNAVVAARVEEGSWMRLEAGDLANLDERGTVFAVETADAVLLGRCRDLEIHPTGPLWGRGELRSGGRIAELERTGSAPFAPLLAMLEAAGLEQERRSLRLVARGLVLEWTGQDLLCRFSLPPGSYATTVLRELLAADAESGAESGGEET
jgi:tRNA pseudouridine13 synthase